jgi:hypothetical protein
MGAAQGFVRRRFGVRCPLRRWCCYLCLGFLALKTLEFFELRKVCVVDDRGLISQGGASSVCNFEASATGDLDKAALLQVALRPAQLTRLANRVCFPLGRIAARSSAVNPSFLASISTTSLIFTSPPEAAHSRTGRISV